MNKSLHITPAATLCGLVICSAFFIVPAALPAAAPAPLTWKAGAASVDITPEQPVWMSGYASRKKPSESVAQHLFAKALAIEDSLGGRMVMVTLDLSTVPRALRDGLERQVKARYGLPPESLLLNASHTHSGPALSTEAVRRMGGQQAPAEILKRADDYAKTVEGNIVQAIGEALSRSGPATLHYTRARAGFAMNRRRPTGPTIQNSPNPDGPVDHDVPVLRVSAPDGSLKAILFGYACHNTVSGTYLINGDYAGHAQAFLEQAHPGAVALFMTGAGGDQNPYPRGKIEQAAEHGRTLANAVEAALSVSGQRVVQGPLRSAIAYVDLDYALPSRAELERLAQSRSSDEKLRGETLIKRLETDGKFPASYPCPVQVVRFGVDLCLIAIGGELTVDYSLRLKRELASRPEAIWVAGYSNDVFGYLGSRRVIIEGGYEGYSANTRGGRHPGPFATTTEDRVIEKAYELIQSLNH